MPVTLSPAEKRAKMARALAKEGFDDVYILSKETATEVLAEKRSEVLDRVNQADVRSVRALADELGRDKGAVSRDLEVLAKHDLVTFDREGSRKIPRAKHETVIVEPVL